MTGKPDPKSTSPAEAGETGGGNQETTEDVDAPFDDGFDENLMAGEDDRQRLAFMSERQREIELYNRAQRREALLARFTVRQKLMQKKLSQVSSSTAKEEPAAEATTSRPAANSPETQPEPQPEPQQVPQQGTKRKETPQSVALGRLVAERKRKRLEKETVEEPVSSTDPILSPSNSDVSSDEGSGSAASSDDRKSSDAEESHDESEDESQAGDAEHRRKATTGISSKEELSRLRLSRFKLATWCHAPFFREVAIGSFVKIGVGVANGQSVYRIAEIVDVVSIPKPYEFEGTRTDKAIRLRHSNSERNFKMAFVSNAPFTDAEFDRWMHTMNKQNQPVPTLEQMELKESMIRYYIDYVYLDEDVEKIVKEKSRLNLRPTNFAVARADLRLEMDIARENRDFEKLEKLEEQMRELDRVSSEARKDESLAKLDAINRRNRQSTMINVEAALLRDAKENRDSEPDPFTRRRCLPTMVTKTKTTMHPNESTAEENTANSEAENKKNGDTQESNCPSAPSPKEQVKDPLADIDLFSIHNFDVDIELPSFDTTASKISSPQTPVRTPVAPVVPLRPTPSAPQDKDAPQNGETPSSSSSNKRLLNLEEYKRRRGLI